VPARLRRPSPETAFTRAMQVECDEILLGDSPDL